VLIDKNKRIEDESGAVKYSSKMLEKKMKEEIECQKRQKEDLIKKVEVLTKRRTGYGKVNTSVTAKPSVVAKDKENIQP